MLPTAPGSCLLVLAPVGLAIIAVISILLMKDITHSLEVLKDGAVRLGGGDLDVVIDTGREDEFNEVAEAFNNMASELKRTTGELRQYAHTVSHDLKGPLSSAMLASGLLADELAANPVSTKEGMPLEDLARMVNNNISNTTDLIDSLLHLAEAGQMPSDVEDVYVSETIEQVLEERAEEIELAGIDVHTSGDLGHIRANPTQIYQLFSNLVSNALKYGAHENPVIDVAYLGRDERGAHRYRVRDNGPGIDPDLMEDVFEPFLKGEHGGTGLGLATVMKVVNVYGGKISASNDKGAIFEFTLYDWQ